MATVSAPRPFSSISFWTPAWALWAPGSASASGTVSAPGPFSSIGFCTRAGAPWAPGTASASTCLANIASRSASIAAIWPSSNSSRSSSAILVLRRGDAHHRTHPRLAPLEGQQRPQQPLAIDLVGLGASTTTRNRDRGRVNHVALDPFLHQSPVDPEPVEPGFLNDDDRIGNSRPS